MKQSIVLTLVAVSLPLFSFGADDKDPDRIIKLKGGEITAGELDHLMEEVTLKQTGGTIRQANSAKGCFVILNAQTRIPAAAFEGTVRKANDSIVCVQMAVKKFDGALDVKNVKPEIVKAGGTLGVGLVDVPDLPSIVTAPEDGWSLVNVAALAADSPKAEVLASRVSKEVLRSLAFVGGGAYLARLPYVMRDVKRLKDLDLTPRAQFGIEVANRIRSSASFYGLVPWRQATYLRACNEGWAPAPTNEYQKAIWDKVHQLPTSPLPLVKPTK